MATYVKRELSVGFNDVGDPFQIFIRKKPDANNQYQYKVNKYSLLNKTIAPKNVITITGLDTWYDFKPDNDYIWLEYNYENNTAAIKSKGKNDTWADMGEVVEFAASGQQPLNAKVILAYSVAINQINTFFQKVKKDLILIPINYNGYRVLYPMEWSGGYKVYDS